MALETIVPGQIWHAQQTLTFGIFDIRSRASFVKLADGVIWVHSPIQPSPELVREINEIGPVKYVVAPNRSHHLFFLPFLQAFPDAQGFIAPGLAEKRPDLQNYPVLPAAEDAPWTAELESLFIEGLPVINETVWFHKESGTLILTDLLFCFGSENSLAARVAAWVLGVYRRLAMSRTMKQLVRDKAALARCADRILAWDVRQVVLAHDQIIRTDAKRQLAEAFRHLA